MTAALEEGEWSAAHPGRTLPPRNTRYPFYRRLGGPQGRFGRTENLVTTVVRSRTVQPVVSRYTDWATGPPRRIDYGINEWMNLTDVPQPPKNVIVVNSKFCKVTESFLYLTEWCEWADVSSLFSYSKNVRPKSKAEFPVAWSSADARADTVKRAHRVFTAR